MASSQDPAASDVIEPARGPAAGDAAADEAAPAAPPELIADSVGDYARIWLQRVRNGESGALPVVLGLIAVVIFFQVRNSLFLSAGNLVNLMIQGAPFILLGMAEIFVLLLGEIDLSVGYNAGSARSSPSGRPTRCPGGSRSCWGSPSPPSSACCEGALITRLGPAVVRGHPGRACSAWRACCSSWCPHTGHGAGGSITNPSNIIYDLTAGNLSPLAGWIVMIVLVGLAGLFMITAGPPQAVQRPGGARRSASRCSRWR